ncbi:unnamed protein product [Arabidopsis halleri]
MVGKFDLLHRNLLTIPPRFLDSTQSTQSNRLISISIRGCFPFLNPIDSR